MSRTDRPPPTGRAPLPLKAPSPEPPGEPGRPTARRAATGCGGCGGQRWGSGSGPRDPRQRRAAAGSGGQRRGVRLLGYDSTGPSGRVGPRSASGRGSRCGHPRRASGYSDACEGRRRGGGGGTSLPATRSASAMVASVPSLRRTVSSPATHACRSPTTSLYSPLGSRRRSDTRRPTSDGDTETTYRAEKCGPM
jgi:hypothetical protein